MSELTSAIVAIPSTFLVVGGMAGATAQVTQANKQAVKKSVYLTGTVMFTASLASKHMPTVVATATSIIAVFFLADLIWFSDGEPNVYA